MMGIHNILCRIVEIEKWVENNTCLEYKYNFYFEDGDIRFNHILYIWDKELFSDCVFFNACNTENNLYSMDDYLLNLEYMKIFKNIEKKFIENTKSYTSD